MKGSLVMRWMNQLASGLVTGGICFLLTSVTATAQGLVFYLPEDGMAVEYEGTLMQSMGDQDPAPLTWTTELSIKSVGREQAEFEGTLQPCRWIEIKVTTGKSGAAGIDPGPVGARIYKVLVPESKIIPEAVDADGIPNHMLPIVKGYRRLGEEAVKDIKAPALRVYPTITLLTNYDDVEVVATADIPEVLAPGLSVSAKRMKGKFVMERPESRSTNVGEYWVTPEVPFGLARWIVAVTREEKESTAPRSNFKPVSTVQVDMKVKRIRQNAESELVTP